MDTLILTGGLGVRLRQVVNNAPKVMASVAGRPFLWYVIEQLRKQGFVDICLAVGYLSKIIVDYFGDGSGFGVNISYSFEDKPLGTAGAIKKAASKLPNEFLVLNGDSYLDVSFDELISFHTVKNSLITMALTESKDTKQYGVVELGPDNEITAFREKGSFPCLSLINAGIYVLNQRVQADIPDHVPVSFEREVLPRYVNKEFFGLRVRGFFTDIGTPASYQQIKDGFPREVLR